MGSACGGEPNSHDTKNHAATSMAEAPEKAIVNARRIDHMPNALCAFLTGRYSGGWSVSLMPLRRATGPRGSVGVSTDATLSRHAGVLVRANGEKV